MIGKNKVAYGAGAYVLGQKSGRKHKKVAVLGAYGVGYERGRKRKILQTLKENLTNLK